MIYDELTKNKIIKDKVSEDTENELKSKLIILLCYSKRLYKLKQEC